MKLRTEIESIRLQSKIDHKSHIFTVGSCFAERIASRLSSAKIPTTSNPFGVMFNPISAISTIDRAYNCQQVKIEELNEGNEGFFHYDFHGSFSRPDKEEAIYEMNRAIDSSHLALKAADLVIITLGTAWVFTHCATDKIVANCHKQPSSTFSRRMLSVEEVANAICEIASNTLRDKRIILTISPIRHLADGLVGNSLSKATLRLAAQYATEPCRNIEYFPSYEILIDDLRDYRFYDEDMVHPTSLAVEYIWQRFKSATFTDEAIATTEKIDAIVAAAAHRPLHPESEAYRQFCRKQLQAIDALPEINFENEREKFAAVLQNL